MANLVIVAIPAEDDYTWKISSEKKPHLTLLFLGDVVSNPNVSKIVEFVEHAATTTLTRFNLSVSKRGTLGADQADVLFFDTFNRWGLKDIMDFRASLLQNDNIKIAYDSTDQFEEGWKPHLTLGYPESPAKEDPRDYPGIHYVEFDRIAVWYGDFEGPEFQLEWDREMDVLAWAEKGTEFLKHHGIKGMKWGSRRAGIGTSKEKVVSEDASKAKGARAKLKKHGVDSLSNEELRTLTNRMDLERKMSTLPSNSKTGKIAKAGAKFTGEVLGNVAKQQVSKLANDVATKQVQKHLSRMK